MIPTDITRQQLCAQLGISESTVYRLEQDGLPFTTVGRKAKRYNLTEVKTWLRENQCRVKAVDWQYIRIKRAPLRYMSISESYWRCSFYTVFTPENAARITWPMLPSTEPQPSCTAQPADASCATLLDRLPGPASHSPRPGSFALSDVCSVAVSRCCHLSIRCAAFAE